MRVSEQLQRIGEEFSRLAKIDNIPAGTALYERTFATGLHPRNIMKNRYTDVLPNEATIFPPAASGVYINGNTVAGESIGADRDFIACQAPRPEYMDEFWTAVAGSGSSLVVNLTGLVEGGRVKSDAYWPTSVGQSLTFGSNKVTLLAETPAAGLDDTVLRTLRHEPSGKQVTLVHYLGWPDMGVPASTKGFKGLVDMVDAVPRTEPVIVHCSAGIGRTGTLIAAYAIRKQRERGTLTDTSIVDVVAALKAARHGMVQRREQLGFVYQFGLQEERDAAAANADAPPATE